jgi:dTDP-4-dehydrorhamnose reductase
MRVLVTGASGQLGSYLVRLLHANGASLTAWSGTQRGEALGVPLLPVDLSDPDAVASAFRLARPDLVLHAAAMAKVTDCYCDPARAVQVNERGSAVLTELAAERSTRLLLVSTDLVFDGERGGYREEDPPKPLSVYGRTKVAAEAAVLSCSRNVVVRVSLLFGPSLSGRPSFFDQQLGALRKGMSLTLFADEWRTPLSLAVAAEALWEVVRSDVTGLLHLGGPEKLSRLEMGQRLAAYSGLPMAGIVAGSRDDVRASEPRPRDTSLDSSRWRQAFPECRWPCWEEAIREIMPNSCRH